MKIAIIYSQTESLWISCKSIVKNLKVAYEHSFTSDECMHFNYNPELSRCSAYSLAAKIVLFRPDKIVFLDHRPHPLNLIEFIKELIDYFIGSNQDLLNFRQFLCLGSHFNTKTEHDCLS